MRHDPFGRSVRLGLALVFLGLFAALLPTASAASPHSEPSAPTTPLDTPTVLVDVPNLGDWAVGGGFLYWGSPCDGSIELRRDGYLKRLPTHGGYSAELVYLPGAGCATSFSNMTADDSGVYYYNGFANRIEMRPLSPPWEPATPIYTTSRPNSRLMTDAYYVYWAGPDNNIYRASKDGSGGFALASTGANPTSVAVDDKYVYWLDADGLWQRQNCYFLNGCPPKQRLSPATGSSLIYDRHHALTRVYTLFWIDNGSPARIHGYACSLILGGSCSDVVLYTAPSDHPWKIGRLVTNGSFFFWTENYLVCSPFCAPSGEGRLRRMPLTSGSVDDIATNLSASDDRIFTDDTGVYFETPGPDQFRPQDISRLPFNASPIVRDLRAINWEVTQGVQSLNNDVDLVAHKTTYVRFYGGSLSGPVANSVEAILSGSRDGQPLPGSPLHPINGTEALQPCFTCFDRSQANSGWLFQLPDDWTQGTISLQGEVDPNHTYADPDRSNNVLPSGGPATLTFTEKAKICAVFVPVRTSAGPTSTNDPNFWRMVDLMQRLWPLPGIATYYQTEDVHATHTCWAGPFPYPCPGDFSIPNDKDAIVDEIHDRDEDSDDPAGCARTHYVGMVNPNYNTEGILGTGSLTYSDSWVKLPPQIPNPPNSWTWPIEGVAMAHEMAHNYGRHHVDCPSSGDNEPTDNDSGYPYDTCKMDSGSTLGASTHFGFDINTLIPIRPDTTTDIMTYQSPHWTSDYTYEALFHAIGNASAKAATPARDAAAPDLAAAGSVVRASGMISPTLQQGRLNYAWVYPTANLSAGILQKWQGVATAKFTATSAVPPSASSAQKAAATYHLRLSGDGGAVLDDRQLTLAFQPVELGEAPVALFDATFPAPTANVARLDLMADNTVVATLQPGPGAPTVTLLQPAGGETFDTSMDIVWRASDPDPQDHLLYTVQYSPDLGRTWRAIETRLPGPPNSDTVTVSLKNLGGLPGSSTGGLIRVAASDGYHTAIATSRPFSVPPRPPEPVIAAPTQGASLDAGAPVVIRGAANDAQDGSLTGGALQWSLDGRVVGSGVEQHVAGLAPGAYDVALTAGNSAGLSRTVHAPLAVAPLRIPQGSAPAMDGLCDDPEYANGIALHLAPYSDGSQATVHLLRTATDLWACFSGLKRGTGSQAPGVSLRVDVDNSRDALAQPGDYLFSMGEDGTPLTLAGDGHGSYGTQGPGGLTAKMLTDSAAWSAEMKISADVLGGWDHMAGIYLVHYWLGGVGDDYQWPYAAQWNAPNTWARTMLSERHVFLPYLRQGAVPLAGTP